MKLQLKFVFNFLFLIWATFLVNIISWLYVMFKIKPNSEIIPLHFNIFYGADYVGNGYYLYLIPLIGLSIFIVNGLFYKYAKNREQFASKLLVVVAFVVQIFVLISVMFLKSIISI